VQTVPDKANAFECFALSAEDKQASPDVDIDPEFQRRMWVVQRAGWIIMGGVVLAALAGVFAGGPLSSAEARDPEGLLRAEYQRFERYQSPAVLRLHVAPPEASNSLTLVIGAALADSMRILRITPEPLEMMAAPEGMRLLFRVSSAQQPLRIRFDVEPTRMGGVRSEIGIAGKPAAAVRWFIYP
jgi:hypothetical protein